LPSLSSDTRSVTITHNPITWPAYSLFGVAIAERGVSHIVSVLAEAVQLLELG